MTRAKLSIPPSAGNQKQLPAKARLIGLAAYLAMKLFCLTYRLKVVDPSGLMVSPPDRPMIWLLWHNRIFVMSMIYKKCLPMRRGAILTSMSRDGDIIAAVVNFFGAHAVRGSSSRRGAAALLNLKEWIRGGFDVLIIPDGPRGPRYRVGPGAVKLAQVTDALLLPIRIHSHSEWAFRGWDHFRLPKPFTTVTVTLGPCLETPSGLDAEEFEKERLRVEHALNPEHETD